jgi:hypothetical protein
MEYFKKIDRSEADKILDALKEFEKSVQQPQYELEQRQDVKIQIRADESISPAMFKPDPLIPGGFIANSLTIRAMRQDVFVLGESIDDLSIPVKCLCSKEIDLQFWKLCPYCATDTKRLL